MSESKEAEPRPWSGGEDEQLIAAYRRGVTLQATADQLDRPLHQIDTRIRLLRRAGHDLPLRRPRWTAEQRKLLAERRRAGASLRELELEFGKTRGTINRQIASLRAKGHDVTPSARRRS